MELGQHGDNGVNVTAGVGRGTNVVPDPVPTRYPSMEVSPARAMPFNEYPVPPYALVSMVYMDDVHLWSVE